MEKGLKESFIEIPLANFNKKPYQFSSSLFETRFAANQKNLIEFKKIIQSRGYYVINLISTQRIIFSTKSAGAPWIGAVQLRELPQSQKNLYLSLNISMALHKTIQPYFMMKNWKIENKIYLHDEKGNGVALVEYHFAESDLRSFIESQRLSKKKIELDRLYEISKMLLQSLHNSHIQNIYLNDIRPETIFYENKKWFIIKGDLAQKIILDYGSAISKPIINKPPNKIYSSPLVYQSSLKNDQIFNHNPFKSDVYSLGIVLLQLQTIGIWTQHQFKQTLQNRKNILTECSMFSLDFRQKLIIKGKQIFMIPNLLQLMLQEKQSQRPYVIEISLLMNFSQLIMSKVLVPHEKFFKFQIIKSTTGKKKIVYPHVSLQYEGNFKQETRQKEGMGIVYHNGFKSFEGTWKNNKPIDKCSVFFSQSWKYQGFIKQDRLHDQGFLFFNGTRLNEKKWYNNLSEDKVDITQKQLIFPVGYYFFVKNIGSEKQQQKQCKAYFKKFCSNKKLLILNTYLVDPKQILFVIHKMLNVFTIKRIKILQQQNKVLYNFGQHQIIIFTTTNNKVIEIITGINHARQLMIKLFQSQILSKQNLQIDLSQTGLQDDELRDIFDKPVKIETFNISKCKITDKGLRILSINQRTKHLKKLNMSYLQISDKAISQFAFSKLIEGLQELNISYCKCLSSQTIATFLCNQKFKKLKRVQIEATSFTHYGLQNIIKFNNFHKLEYLNIGLCHKINDAYFNIFLKNKIASDVAGLCLNSTILTDSILETMGSQECRIKSLSSINLSGSINLSFYGLSKLFLSSKVKTLKNINLSGTYIDDQFLALLANKAHFKCKVKQLHISSCFAITDKGVLRLLKSQHFSQLSIFDISKTFISNDLLINMVDLPNRIFTHLIFTKCTKINDNGLQKLIMSENFKKVQILNIGFLAIQSLTFTALANSRNSGSLKQLILQECTKIEQKNIIDYFCSSNFKALQKIVLTKTLISNRVLESFEANSFNNYRFIQIDINECKNITKLQYICLPNKLISTIQRKSDMNNSIKCLSKSPLLLKMTQLKLSTEPQTDFPSLFESQYCMNLNTIDINDSSLKNCFESMAKSKYLKNIKILTLKSCSIDENSFKLFLKSENVTHLEQLDISWTLLGNPTLFAISESQCLNYLEVLKIIKCININDKGMARYLNSKVCQSLKILDLRATLLTNNTLESLAKSNNIKQLTHLSIRSCSNMKNLGLEHFIYSKNCHNIKVLDLSWNGFTGDVFKYLTNSKQLTELKQLQASGLKKIQTQLNNYLNSNNVNSLTRLDISSTVLTSSTIHSLGFSQSLQSLNELNLASCNLPKPLISSLLSSKNMQKIHKLNLTSNSSPAQIMKTITEHSSKFQKLQTLILSSTKNINIEQISRIFKNLILQ